MQTANIEAMFSSVAECLNTGAMKAIVELRASPQQVERIEWLGERANEGLLTSDERQEYQSCVMFSNFIGILQSKARHKLKVMAR